MVLFQRTGYLDKLSKWRDKDLIKVLTGIRRGGKSTLLELFRMRLEKDGVPPERIVFLNFEDPDCPDFDGWRDAWNYIKPHISREGKTYVFLDEVQRVREYEKLVDGLWARKNIDVYITGSNAYFLSGNLATFLSGRYVEINVQPLSFAEYCQARKVSGDYAFHYAEYTKYGSFPYAITLDDEGLLPGYLDGIYNTVLVKDVLNRKRLSDSSIVDRVARFLFDNIGNLTSVRKIAGCLTSSGTKTNGNTIDGYLNSLCEAFLFRKAERYDVRGKGVLENGCKYYAADMGLRARAVGYRVGDAGRILENIVYLELLRRSSNVFVGWQDGREIDFVTRDGGVLHYYQVAETVRDEETRKREFAPLLANRDNYPKTLITLDPEPQANLDGITQINAIEFLLQPPPFA